MRRLFFMTGLLLLLGLTTYNVKGQNHFVKAVGSHFEINNKPYYFIGANYWYGPLLASEGEGGNRERLIKELDFMKSNGINNLRILVGAEGPDNQPRRVTPTLQVKQGQYNDTLLAGLDFLLSEMGKREMYAVIYLGNTWDWSGGYSQYLNWNGKGKIPYLYSHGWNRFKNYDKKFLTNKNSKNAFYNHVKYIVSRTNRYTGIPYTQDPAIMAWQITNEPRALAIEKIPTYIQWITKTAALIKSIDKNHLVSTGSEGKIGCENDMKLYRRIHANRNIDYLTLHIWPKNWNWIKDKNIHGTVHKAIAKANAYMLPHFKLGKKLNKPVVVEEFGLPRDHHKYSLSDSTISRDKFYKDIFNVLLRYAKQKGSFAGCNFWAFGGTARPLPGQPFWKRGDDLMGDPPQEEQGLNAVFDTDSTIKLVHKYNSRLKVLLEK
ncbi:MAG: beta-mannosidase [Bacteroidota bacterium]|nr:beta-mannosidase [Bacteroidota bacterium]